MKVIRLAILVLVLTGAWASSALGMPASDPDTLSTQTAKAQPRGGGFDWTPVEVGVGGVAGVVLAAETLVGIRRRQHVRPVRV